MKLTIKMALRKGQGEAGRFNVPVALTRYGVLEVGRTYLVTLTDEGVEDDE